MIEEDGDNLHWCRKSGGHIALKQEHIIKWRGEGRVTPKFVNPNLYYLNCTSRSISKDVFQ